MEEVVEGGILVGEQVVFAKHNNPIIKRESSASSRKIQSRRSSINNSSPQQHKLEYSDIEEISAETNGTMLKNKRCDDADNSMFNDNENNFLACQDLRNSAIQRKAAERIAKKLLKKSAAISFTSKYKSASTPSLSSKKNCKSNGKDHKGENSMEDEVVASSREEEDVSSNISSDSCIEEDEEKLGNKSGKGRNTNKKQAPASTGSLVSIDSGVPSSRSSLSSSGSSQNFQILKEDGPKETSDLDDSYCNTNMTTNTAINLDEEKDSQYKEQQHTRLSRNAEQIEALLKRINEENKRTREVLDNIQKPETDSFETKTPRTSLSHQFRSTSTVIINALSNSMSNVKERTTSTFLDAYNNNNNNKFPNLGSSKDDHNGDKKHKDHDNTQQQEEPMVTWETSGEGKKIPIVIFSDQALSRPQAYSVGSKYHLTFKTVNADAKLISQICHAHGFHEVHASNTDYNLNWTGIHPKPHAFKSMLPHQRVNHFPRSYELTRKDRLYQNIERLQHSKGSKHFNFVPKTFMIPAGKQSNKINKIIKSLIIKIESFLLPAEYSEFAATHHRMRGAWIVKPVASSRGRGIFIVSHPSQVPLDEPMVVAKYIDNPLLVNGHKWDLRLYVAVTSYDPLIIYLYEEGLVRFATVRYDSSGKNLWNPCMHLCNYR